MDEERLIRLLAAHAQSLLPTQPDTNEEAAWQAERLSEFYRRVIDKEIEPIAPTAE